MGRIGLGVITLQWVSVAVAAAAIPLQNFTGLPVYPSLSKASMDPLTRSDTLGHLCSRFAAETSYPLSVVEAWYRKTLVGASETDLRNDPSYKTLANLSGIKLATGIDYVTVYRAAAGTTTAIELFKCS